MHSTGGYTPTKSLEQINLLMYMDDMKLFAKNEKELETLIQTIRIYSQDIGIKFARKTVPIRSGKRLLTKE